MSGAAAREADRAPGEPDSPIEAYLDELVGAMSTQRPRELRHLLAEIEAHLRDDAAHGVAGGLRPTEAELQAVRRLGPARALAAQERRHQAVPLRTLLRRVLASAVLLGAFGALAVGVSGVLALVARLVGGIPFLVDVPPDRVLSASDCARWLAGDPGAATCHDAAVADWAAEIVGMRIAVGLVGLMVLVALWRIRRRRSRLSQWSTLPATLNETIAVTLFAAAAVLTSALAVDAFLTSGGHGSGQWISAAVASLAAAAVFGWRVLHDLRRDAGPPA